MSSRQSIAQPIVTPITSISNYLRLAKSPSAFQPMAPNLLSAPPSDSDNYYRFHSVQLVELTDSTRLTCRIQMG